MKPIRLPEPPSSPTVSGGGLPDIFEGSVYRVIRRAVVIGNGFPSSENQSLGLVRALGLSDRQTFYRVTRPTGGVNEWLHWLPVFIHKKLYYIITTLYRYSQFIISGGNKRILSVRSENGGSTGLSSILEADVKTIVSMARDEYEDAGPLLVIASGRDTISTASSIKRLASEKVFVIQIQHPRSHLNRFDLVITPHHDYYPLTPQAQEQIPRLLRRWITPRDPPDTHVVLTLGSLHQIDSTSLRNAAITWNEEFSSIPKPLHVVNIGGPTGQCRYGLDLAKQLVASLDNVLASCGSVRISFSKRTPNKISSFIVKDLGNHPKVYIWDGQGPNPHMGHLAWADSFIITADSVSMLSEACSTGKPVYVIGAERCKWKFMEFHKSLRDRGLVRPFTGLEDMAESWSYPPLNDTADAAQKVHEELAKRGWKIRA